MSHQNSGILMGDNADVDADVDTKDVDDDGDGESRPDERSSSRAVSHRNGGILMGNGLIRGTAHYQTYK